MGEEDFWREFSASSLHLEAAAGILDRETILNLLFREADRAQRMKTGFCVLLLRIDQFCDRQAELGPETCDELLRQLGARVIRRLRSYDAIGRYAEDTLLLVLPGCNPTGAALVYERIRRKVLDLPFLVGGENLRCSVHFGFAMSHGQSPLFVLHDAERLLDRARHGGQAPAADSRNSVAFDLDGVDGEKFGKDIVR
ncbi:MAG TPA: diguanylate cyclase [Terracidiphilus sp.]|nr:diguanylate cyclase [Terracidiphilus sp.]